MTYTKPAQQEAYEAYLARVDVPTLVVELRARIEALTAERDAAITEGERRATAAIVAWLRETNGVASNGVVRTAAAIACAIERNDHLTAHKPLDT